MNPSPLSVLFLVRLICPASWFLAFILLAPPEWVKPLMERQSERDWLLSWRAHASHVLHYFISCLLILEYK